MKRGTFVPYVLVLIVLSTGIAGTAVASAGDAGAQAERPADGPVNRTIAVSGEGTAEAPPDEAVVSIAVVATGDDPAAVRTDLQEGTDALRRALANDGVEDDQVRTTEYAIGEPPRDPYEERDREPPAYRGVHAVHVTLDDVNRTGAVVDAAADAGADVRWVAFALSDERRAELRDGALTDAMDDARRQADTLAAAGELRVTGVRSVDATERGYVPVGVDQEAVADAGEGATVLDPGDVAVSVRVRVTYDAA